MTEMNKICMSMSTTCLLSGGFAFKYDVLAPSRAPRALDPSRPLHHVCIVNREKPDGHTTAPTRVALDLPRILMQTNACNAGDMPWVINRVEIKLRPMQSKTN